MSIKTSNYKTNREVRTGGIYDEKTIPAGTWVKPIDHYYLPQHIKDSIPYKYAKHDTEVFCYTSYGMVLIPREAIVES